MQHFLNLDNFPIDRPDSHDYRALVAKCKDELVRDGMYNLHGFMRPEMARKVASDLTPKMETDSFTHKRSHNIYFSKSIPDLAVEHPALQLRDTINHTLCADQIENSPIIKIYQYTPLVRFLAETMGKPRLYTMDDPLARVNVMSYYEGEALNWHFDRSEFTTTLLLRAPSGGGAFEYRSDLRSDDHPNYDGVARLLNGDDPDVRQISLSEGTLNVFRGRNTAHRVTPIESGTSRMITVFSYYDQPGVQFSSEERIGFFGRDGVEQV